MYREAVENLKDYDVSVSLEDSEKFLDGVGKAVVTLKNKVNQKEAVVKFEVVEPDRHSEEWYDAERSGDDFDEWDEDMEIFIDGKCCYYDGAGYYGKKYDWENIEAPGRDIINDPRYVNESTFFEKMVSYMPPEPYDAIYMMAVVAVTPEVGKIENKFHQDKANNEKLNRKILSEFMNNGRSEEGLKGFDVSVDVSVEPGKYSSGEGKAVVTLENKANQKAVVEFEGTKNGGFGEPVWYEKEFNIIVEGKKIFHNVVEIEGPWSDSFLENMKSNIPPKPYDAIYEMAVIAATPKVENVEKECVKKYLAEKKEREERLKQEEKERKLKRSLQEKALSDFMNRGRS